MYVACSCPNVYIIWTHTQAELEMLDLPESAAELAPDQPAAAASAHTSTIFSQRTGERSDPVAPVVGLDDGSSYVPDAS